jgi:hypothetical protein
MKSAPLCPRREGNKQNFIVILPFYRAFSLSSTPLAESLANSYTEREIPRVKYMDHWFFKPKKTTN